MIGVIVRLAFSIAGGQALALYYNWDQTTTFAASAVVAFVFEVVYYLVWRK